MELKPAQAANEWKSKEFRPAYYLLGEDEAAKEEAARTLKAAIQPDAFNLDEFSDSSPDPQRIVSAALTPPTFADRRLVVVKSRKLPVDTRRAIAEYLADPLDSTTLVLFSEDRKADVRDVLAGAVSASNRHAVVAYNALKEDEARHAARDIVRKAGATLAEDGAALLIEICGTESGVLKGELEKILLYARGKKTISREDVLACMGYTRSANPFDFQRILQTRDCKKALAELQKLLDEDAEPIALLYKVSGTLNRQLKARRLKAAGKGDDEILRSLRLHTYYDRDFIRCASAVPEATLVSSLKACLELEAKLKSETWLDGRIELERFVAAICKPAAERS